MSRVFALRNIINPSYYAMQSKPPWFLFLWFCGGYNQIFMFWQLRILVDGDSIDLDFNMK
jgi:hypothetical protein